MDKQKKQILILVVVLVLGGGIVLFMNRKSLFGEAAPPPAPPADPSVAAGAPATPGAPGAAPGTPGAAVAPVVVKDSPMPDLTVPGTKTVTAVRAGDNPKPFDPLLVLDSTVSYKTVAKDIQELREKWKLVGIAEAGTEIVKVTTYEKKADGTIVPTVKETTRTIWACFFADYPRFYREGDRLGNTDFAVKTIVFREGYIEAEGDTGAIVKLLIMSDARYK